MVRPGARSQWFDTLLPDSGNGKIRIVFQDTISSIMSLTDLISLIEALT